MLLRNVWPDLWIGVQSPNSCQVDIARDEADTQLPVQAERLQALDEHASLMKVRGCIPVICNAQAVSRFDERFHHTHTVSAWTQNELLASAHVFPLNTCKVHSSTVEHPEQACSTATQTQPVGVLRPLSNIGGINIMQTCPLLPRLAINILVVRLRTEYWL